MSRGFTLIEVVIALAVGAIAVLSAQVVLAGATRAYGRLGAFWASGAERAIAHRWLEDASYSLSVGGPNDHEFEGTANRMVASAWVLVPQGWRERQLITLRQVGDDVVLDQVVGRIVIAQRVAAMRLSYRQGRGGADQWVEGWRSPVAAPVAVRMALQFQDGSRDTAVLLTGWQ